MTDLSLKEATESRYAYYALSVVHSRALPDVRDGLKPVQRRILYAMYQNLGLVPSGRYKKSAAVVGEVMAKFHPHGDSAIYETIVRMAQDFANLHPLIDGQGNWGSQDGDNAAASRYTECKLLDYAVDMVSEVRCRTVPFRATYDNTSHEPIVLPAQVPNILLNGSEGIAVGMATRIPPHNLGEVADACIACLSGQDFAYMVKGPDFPTNGQIVADKEDIENIYREGQGSIKVRATWVKEQRGRKHYVIITSIPYGVVKGPLLEKLGGIVEEKKLPQITDVRDESTTDVRIVVELRHANDADAAMAWLFKHTALQTPFHINLTCLVPTENPEVCSPQRLGLRSMIEHWCAFRVETVRRRLQFELSQVRDRVHILEGYALVLGQMQILTSILQNSADRTNCVSALMQQFKLDMQQAEAILELKLYRIAKLELKAIHNELSTKRSTIAGLEAKLSSETKIKEQVVSELRQIKQQYGRDRKTSIINEEEPQDFNDTAYIQSEDAYIICTREGYLKRTTTAVAWDKVRVKEGDGVLAIEKGATAATVSCITSAGKIYTLVVNDLPSGSGYGDPIQKFFALGDKEKVCGIISNEAKDKHIVIVTQSGKVLRTPLKPEVTTKNGKACIKLEEGDSILCVGALKEGDMIGIATQRQYLLSYPVGDIPIIEGIGRGVNAISLREGDQIGWAGFNSGIQTGEHTIPVEKVQGKRSSSGKLLSKTLGDNI